jgi:hypothetical protein
LNTYRTHKKEVTCELFATQMACVLATALTRDLVPAISWHPQFESVFASGSFDGHIKFWLVQ